MSLDLKVGSYSQLPAEYNRKRDVETGGSVAHGSKNIFDTAGSVAEKPANIFESSGAHGRKPKNIFEEKLPQETAGQVALLNGGKLDLAA